MHNKITIITATHCTNKCRDPLKNPPGTWLLSNTIRSFRETFPDLYKARHILAYDLSGTNCDKLYKDNLTKLADENGLELITFPQVGYKTIRCLTATMIKTKYTFILEHDWVWLRAPDLASVIDIFDNDNEVNYIRFNKRSNIVKPIPMASGRVGGDIELSPIIKGHISLLATPHYTNNPHIERTNVLRDRWVPIVESSKIFEGKNSGAGGFEHPLQEASYDAYKNDGLIQHNKHWGLFIYGFMNDPAVIRHIGE